jgi:hypothetical protein
MRSLFVVGFLLVFSTWGGQAVHAQPAAGAAPHIEWEFKNRFLFRNEADFQRHVAAMRSDGVLAAERRLASETDGRGWARDMIERLCVDRVGRLLEFCDRDGEREIYLAPRDHRVGVTLAGTLPANEGCAWSFDDGDGHPRGESAGAGSPGYARPARAFATCARRAPAASALRIAFAPWRAHQPACSTSSPQLWRQQRQQQPCKASR